MRKGANKAEYWNGVNVIGEKKQARMKLSGVKTNKKCEKGMTANHWA